MCACVRGRANRNKDSEPMRGQGWRDVRESECEMKLNFGGLHREVEGGGEMQVGEKR